MTKLTFYLLFSLFLSTLQGWLLLTWTTAVETNKRPYILRCPIVRPVAWPLSSACCLGLYLYPPLSVNKLGSKRRKTLVCPAFLTDHNRIMFIEKMQLFHFVLIDKSHVKMDFWNLQKVILLLCRVIRCKSSEIKQWNQSFGANKKSFRTIYTFFDHIREDNFLVSRYL